MSNLPNLREDVNNLLREVVGDDKTTRNVLQILMKKIVTMKKCYYLSKII